MLRLLLAAALASPLVSVRQGPIQAGAGREVFHAPLRSNGIYPGSWPGILTEEGVPAPTVTWYASDPLGAGGITSHAYTLTGSTEALGAPYCPSGDFSGVDEQDGRCMVARRFDGTSDYYSGPAVADINGGSLTTCAIIERQNSGTVVVASERSSSTSRGWALYATASAAGFGAQGDAGGGFVGSTVAFSNSYSWGVVCGTASVANGICGYVNGTKGTCLAYPSGSTSAGTAALEIGSQQGGSSKFAGNVVASLTWPGVEYTEAQIKSITQYLEGLLGTRGELATYAGTGSRCCMIDGMEECFSDGHPLLGCDGSASDGYEAHPSVTNSALYSRTLTSGWGVVGSSVVACNQTVTPFRDGRTTCKITDDDASGQEWVYQTLDISALDTGSKIAVCIWAMADTAGYLDLTFDENTGTGCTATTTDFTPAAITDQWAQYQWTHTVRDGDCTVGAPGIYPYQDRSAAALTGSAYLIVGIYKGQDWCPSEITETTSAAVAYGGDLLGYAVTAPIVNATGTIVGTERLTVNWTPLLSAAGWPSASQGVVAAFRTSGSDYAQLYDVLGTSLQLYSSPGGTLLNGALSVVAGTTYANDLQLNYDRDTYALRVDGAQKASSSSAFTSPSGIYQLWIGSSWSGGQSPGGAIISNVRITR